MPALSRADARLIRALERRKSREAEGLFRAEGVRVVEELLRAGLAPRLALVSPKLVESERGRALRAALDVGHGPSIREVGDGELARLSETRTPQGVLVVAPTPRPELAGLQPRGRAFALVLDGVQDPGNLGTLARSAAAFGCMALICLPGTVDPWNAKAVRSSAGALFHLPVVVPDPAVAWEWLDEHGFAAWGADAAGEPVNDATRPQRVALVVGNEGAGLGAEARSRCARQVAVPMAEGTESLNVAVAAGILMYAITRESA